MISHKNISKQDLHTWGTRDPSGFLLLQMRFCQHQVAFQLLLTTVINSDQYWETGGSKADDIWTCLKLSYLHAWCSTSKIPGPWFCTSNWDMTYPWPIFSNRVYFFLGSPTLTMLPERNKMQDSHFTPEIPPSSRSKMQPHCLGLWAICGQLSNNNSNRGSSTAQMASINTDLLQSFRVTLTRNWTQGETSRTDRDQKTIGTNASVCSLQTLRRAGTTEPVFSWE